MKGPVKIVVCLVIIIAAVVGTYFVLSYRAQVTEYNAAIELVNDPDIKRHVEGIAALEKFYAGASGSLRTQAKDDLLKSYRTMANLESQPISEAVRWYKKVAELDPAALMEGEKKMLASDAKRAEMRAKAATQPAEPEAKPATTAASDADDEEEPKKRTKPVNHY